MNKQTSPDFLYTFGVLQGGTVDAAANTAALVPDGMRIESLEKFANVPDRSRGAFIASSLEAVLDYANEEPNSNVRVFCGINTVVAVLNFYDGDCPGWKDNVAMYDVEESVAFLAIKDLAGTVQQEKLVEYIDDWMPLLSFSRGGKQVSATVARGLFANLTIDQVRKSSSEVSSFKRERSVTETLAGGDNTPDIMVVRAATIEGLPAVDVPCSLGVAEIAGNPAVSVRIIGEKVMEERTSAEFIRAVEYMFEDFVVFNGNYSSNQFPS